MFSILLLLQFCLVISNAWINRQSDGDLFDAAYSACHGYNAQCTKLIFGSCCNECQCDEGYTVYRNSCRSDLSRSVLGCKCFIKDSSHYGMKTHTFRDHETSIGCIMCTQGQHATCVLNSGSQYWNTISWESLFTNGRKKEDFAILNSVNGTYLKFLGNSYNQPLYEGLLMNLKLSCTSLYGNNITSCLTIVVQGKRSYDKEPPAVPTTSTTTGSTTRMTTTSGGYNCMFKIGATPNHTTLTPTSAPNTNEGRSLQKLPPIIAVAALALTFCIILVYCYSKRKRQPETTTRLIDGNIYGYQTNSSSEPALSAQLDIIPQPSYPDMEELGLGFVNSELRRAMKKVGGILYVNHYSDSEQSTNNDSSSINERSNTRNVLHSISGNGNLKVTQ